MANYNDQTITFTYDELKVIRNAIIMFENTKNTQYDDLYDKVEYAIHTAIAESIREHKKV